MGVKLKTLLQDAIELNLQDKKQRYVFYTEGQWQMGVRLPSIVDYREFYVVENGSSYTVCL